MINVSKYLIKLFNYIQKVFDFEVEGQRKKGRPKRTWKKQVEEESVKVV